MNKLESKSVVRAPGGASVGASSAPSKTSTIVSKAAEGEKDEDYYVTPEFIYGGPFIAIKKPSPFIDSVTPMNIPLQGTFTKSFAYFSLKDRLPIIITKVIDELSKKGGNDCTEFIKDIAELKNDLMTNKEFKPFTIENDETKKWNQWIYNLPNKKYYNSTWLFTECYVYRRLYQGCELYESLKTYDYFSEKKKQAFTDNLKPMVLAAEKVLETWGGSSKPEKKKADLITLLKLMLWANKCDLSLSIGEKVVFGGADEEDASATPPPPPPPAEPKSKGKGKEPPKFVKPTVVSSDPFQMILDLKDMVVVDDSAKIADQIMLKADNMQKAVNANTVFKQKCSCHRLARSFGTQICEEEKYEEAPPEKPAETKEGEKPAEPEAEPELPKIPCPAKMTLPLHVMFDIVCDNAGYELFADLCFASFLLEQKIVEMVRFHVKKMPWFVSDVTRDDFAFVIDSALKATYDHVLVLPPGPDGEVERKAITAEPLNKLGKLWTSYLNTNKFVLMADDYWTYPHGFYEMKKIDYQLYRKLQYAVCVLFKGDLNYRKLLADRNVNPYSTFEPNLQGFIPAPIIAVRTVKSEVVCGLPKGKFDLITKADPEWMRTGEFGVIQFSPKAEPLKVSDRPCMDYCDNCFGVICPEHLYDM